MRNNNGDTIKTVLLSFINSALTSSLFDKLVLLGAFSRITNNRAQWPEPKKKSEKTPFGGLPTVIHRVRLHRLPVSHIESKRVGRN